MSSRSFGSHSWLFSVHWRCMRHLNMRMIWSVRVSLCIHLRLETFSLIFKQISWIFCFLSFFLKNDLPHIKCMFGRQLSTYHLRLHRISDCYLRLCLLSSLSKWQHFITSLTKKTHVSPRMIWLDKSVMKIWFMLNQAHSIHLALLGSTCLASTSNAISSMHIDIYQNRKPLKTK